MTDQDEGTWRVWFGAGLLANTPMSDEWREAFRKEAEREAKQAEAEAEARRDAALERRWDLQRQGEVPHSIGDVFALQGRVEARADAIEAKREAAALEAWGRGKPARYVDRWSNQQNVAAAQAERGNTPATVAALSEVRGELLGLKAMLAGVLKRGKRR